MTTPNAVAELLLRPARIFLPTGEVVANQVVLVRGDQIVYVGDEAAVPAQAIGVERTVLDYPGSTLMPGFIDLHLLVKHARGIGAPVSNALDVLSATSLLDRCLRRGITTVRDTASSTDFALDLRELLKAGTIRGPRLHVAGTPMGAGGRGGAVYRAHEVDGPYEARRAARRIIREGVDFLSMGITNGLAGGGGKVNGEPGWQELRQDEVDAATVEARAAGRPVSANAIGLSGIHTAIRAGIDTIEHATAIDSEAADLMAERGITLVPTLTVKHQFVDTPDAVGFPASMADRAKVLLETGYRCVEIAQRAGVRIAVGTDSHGVEDAVTEIKLLSAAGLSNTQVLLAATATAGAVLGPTQPTVGRLEAGAAADLVVLDGDVLTDITAVERVRQVIRGGRLVESDSATTAEQNSAHDTKEKIA